MTQPFLPRELWLTAVAFLVAPLGAGVSLALAATASAGALGTQVEQFFVLAVIFYYYAAIATLIFAFPAFVVLRRFAIIRWWSTALAGFVIGLLVGFLVSPSQAYSVMAGGLGGAISATVFWLIWRQSQPELPGPH